MAFIFYILLFIFIFVLLSAVGIIGTITRILFGNTRPNQKSTPRNDNRQNRQSTTTWYSYQKTREKIFDKTDGEYVEFEEIKDERTNIS